MGIAEKLVTIAENEQKVYEAGKQAEYDRFWDTFQNNGGERNYYYKFSYTGWTDENFNPKYPIITTTGTTAGMALFHANVDITDTKVPIVVKGSNAGSMFYNARSLITVRILNVHEGVALDSTFLNCSSLKNITFEGVIGRGFDVSYSPLSVDSMKSIISHLKNYAGTANEYKYTVKFKGDCWTALEAESTAPDGGTWKNYVETLGWNI